MSLPYRPIADSHAIEACTITIRFAQSVDPETFAAIRARAKKIADSLDLPAEMQLSMPQFLGGIVPQQLVPQMGVVFQRFAKNGQVETELKCELSAISLTIRSYPGWQELRAFADATILELVPLYMSVLPAISGVSIQYDDKFDGGPANQAGAAGEIFRPGTPWVVIYDAKSTQQWHSTMGIFVPKTENCRELLNVNVTVNDTPQAGGESVRYVGMTIVVSENFDVPGQPPLIVEQERAGQCVGDLMDVVHARQREILHEVLSDDYLSAIGAGQSNR